MKNHVWLLIVAVFIFSLPSCSLVKTGGEMVRRTGEVMSDMGEGREGFIGGGLRLGGNLYESIGSSIETAGDRTEKGESAGTVFADANREMWDNTSEISRDYLSGKDEIKPGEGKPSKGVMETNRELWNKAGEIYREDGNSKSKKVAQNTVANERERMKGAQRVCKEKGYYKGKIDGLYGPKTRSAICDYQKANGLSVTGQLDQETVAHMGI